MCDGRLYFCFAGFHVEIGLYARETVLPDVARLPALTIAVFKHAESE
jgi:hypothetical protein